MDTLLSRQPSIFRRALRIFAWGLAGASLVTAAGLTGHYLVEGTDFRVYDVQFEGNVRATPAQLRHLSDLRSGQHLATVDLERAVAGVSRHPWVAHASARRALPGSVVFVIEEHKPVMLLALDELWYVDASGVPFKRVQGESLDFPVLSGMDPKLVEEHPDLASAVIGRSLKLLAAAEAPPLHGAAAVSEVHFHHRSGFALVLRTGTRLILGFSDPAARLNRLARMVEQGLDLSKPQRIDLDGEAIAVATPLSSAAASSTAASSAAASSAAASSTAASSTAASSAAVSSTSSTH